MVFALGSRSETLRSDDELAPYRHSCCWALVPWLGFSSPSTEPYQEKPPSVTHAHRKLTVQRRSSNRTSPRLQRYPFAELRDHPLGPQRSSHRILRPPRKDASLPSTKEAPHDRWRSYLSADEPVLTFLERPRDPERR